MSTTLDFLNFGDDDDEYVSNDSNPIETSSLSTDEINQMLMDLSLDQTNRKALIADLNSREPLLLMDTVANYCISYTENETLTLKEVLLELGNIDFLPFTLRLKCLLTLEDDLAIISLVEEQLKVRESHELKVPVHGEQSSRAFSADSNNTLLFEAIIDCVDANKPRCVSCLETIFGNFSLEQSYRYKLLLNAFDRYQMKDIKGNVFCKHEDVIGACAHAYLYSALPEPRLPKASCFLSPKYMVFAAQLLQRVKQLTEQDCEHMFNLTLLEAYVQESGQIDVVKSDLAAAEICDFLIGCDKAIHIVDKTKERLMKIQGADVIQMFKSTQNVHQVSADIEGFIKDLIDYEPAEFGIVVNALKSREWWNEAVANSLNRFQLDAGLYSSYAMSLSSMLGRVWMKIQQHDNSDTLIQRLCEELADMSDTCSSGHLYRLVNVFSGFEGGIKMSIKDEMVAVLQHRVTQLIKKQTLEVQEQIIEELEKENQEVIVKYLYREMAILHDMMREEYRGLINDITFTEYFRTALTKYTCVFNA